MLFALNGSRLIGHSVFNGFAMSENSIVVVSVVIRFSASDNIIDDIVGPCVA